MTDQTAQFRATNARCVDLLQLRDGSRFLVAEFDNVDDAWLCAKHIEQSPEEHPDGGWMVVWEVR